MSKIPANLLHEYFMRYKVAEGTNWPKEGSGFARYARSTTAYCPLDRISGRTPLPKYYKYHEKRVLNPDQMTLFLMIDG